jgi:hypothetical protein
VKKTKIPIANKAKMQEVLFRPVKGAMIPLVLI